MVKATIKSKTGAVITIEGTNKEVSDILSTFERTVAVGHAKAVAARGHAEKKEQKKRASVSDLIVTLQEEGFFDKAKSLGEISTALEEKGYLCPVTSLSGIMLSLVKRRLFRRKKVEGKWVYGK
jgi:hypothetical protein